MRLNRREQDQVETELGLAVESVDPPPELKDAIMAKLATTPQLPADSPGRVGDAELRASARWFRRPLITLVAAAAVLIAFAGGLFLGTAVAPTPGAVAQAERLASLTTADDLERASSDVAGGGSATLLWSNDERSSALLVDGLPSLPSGKTYQLWYINAAGAAVSAGTFDASDAETTWRVLDGALGGGDTVGLTIEPDGGSPAPTTDPILAVTTS